MPDARPGKKWISHGGLTDEKRVLNFGGEECLKSLSWDLGDFMRCKMELKEQCFYTSESTLPSTS